MLGDETTAAGDATVVIPAPNKTAPTAVQGPIQFLPIVGIPPDKAPLLAEALAQSAQAASVTLQPLDGGTAPQRLKGYLSAIREPQDTLVVYVWDVLDAADERSSRIQGQVRIQGVAEDPWTLIGPEEFSRIANETITALRDPTATGDNAG